MLGNNNNNSGTAGERKMERRFTEILRDIQLDGRKIYHEEEEVEDGTNDLLKISQNLSQLAEDMVSKSPGRSRKNKKVMDDDEMDDLMMYQEGSDSISSGGGSSSENRNKKYAEIAAVTTFHAERVQRRSSIALIAEEVANIARTRSSIYMMGDLAMGNDDDDDDDDKDVFVEETKEIEKKEEKEKEKKDILNDEVLVTNSDAHLAPTLAELGLLPGDLDPAPPPPPISTLLPAITVLSTSTLVHSSKLKDEEEQEQMTTGVVDTDSLEGTPLKKMDGLLGADGKTNTPAHLTNNSIHESPMGTKEMEDGWTSTVYTEEQQKRLGIDAMGEPINTALSSRLADPVEESRETIEVVTSSAAPVAPETATTRTAKTLPPAWITNNQVEPPAGEADMGGWVAAVYTIEQQERLGVDEHGVQREDMISSSSSSNSAQALGVKPAIITEPTSTPPTQPIPTQPKSQPKKSTFGASQRLAQVAARSKSRQLQLSKKREERALRSVEAKSSPYAAKQKAIKPARAARVLKGAGSKKGRKAAIAPTSYMTSPSMAKPTTGGDGTKKKVNSSGQQRRGKKKKSLEEIEAQKKREARERRAKVKAIDEVSYDLLIL
jgi:hypothetical protein